MSRVRPIMGVCPQFDVLWDQLTGLEHLRVFAAIKGIPRADRKHEVAKLLEEVKLTEAGRVRAGAYSGGMRRRLSVAIALLGDPKASGKGGRRGRCEELCCRELLGVRGLGEA